VSAEKLRETMPMRPMLLLAAALSAIAVLPAAAQAPQATTVRIRGTVESFDGHTLLVDTREGPKAKITLAPNFVVSGMAKRSLADIKDGMFVASTSVKGTDGMLHAVEIHILPESVRSVAKEGQFPFDLVPNSVMTNADAAGVASAPHGHVLHVTWKGGAADLAVGPDTPIVAYVPGDAGLLKPGATIMIFAAQKHPDGSLTAARVTAEKDGVKPPM
jgi:hypothetical protein